ncbi:YegP family protein [Ferruginibacter sp. HRS2-29]|uniref:YegP family protein n=1 Tax=Ferruginibacter sp. HRS2-29 TaxID=2487334 RepID=UPI0020CBF111|nr:YegP family protein [Ferruginibacter sp. HRS2-29]MCP9750698.1 DUF1508 domain-containing protein [Ferruginibacter sp. HRS2-29]
MGKFVISQRANGQYYFSLKADNGEIVLASEGYTSKVGCLRGVDAVKVNARDESKFDRKSSTNAKYYFNLKAANGQIIGTSEMYQTSVGRDNGIDVVKRVAPVAVVNDLSS